MCLTKKQHDLRIRLMIDNLAHDEAAYNIDNRLSFREPSDVYCPILEELEEVEEALKTLNKEVRKFFEFIRYNESQENILKQLKVISLEGSSAIHEALQVKAVALKAIKQLGDACSHEKCNTNDKS